jgi:ferrous-iron efflux pump FieF
MMPHTSDDALSDQSRAKLIRAASYASISVAVALVIVKAWAWRTTGSVALLSSLADSVLDVMASALTVWAVRYSLSPADTEHRFGHGKSEGLAALLQSLIIAASGLFVCFEAIQRLMAPQPIRAPETGLAVIIGATVATLLLVTFQRYVARRTGSVAIHADAMHYRADVVVNIGVGAALLLSTWTNWQPVDPLVGLAVAAFILWGTFAILRQSLDILLDREIPDEERAEIRRIALEHPDVRGMHDMKTRFGGNHYIIQFHVEMDPQITLTRSHEILDEIEAIIRTRYRRCEIIIHADPLNYPEQRDFIE